VYQSFYLKSNSAHSKKYRRFLMSEPIQCESNDPNVAAVFGEHTAGAGAVIGQSNNGRGVIGISEAGQGVWGVSVSSTGVVGESTNGWGVSGSSETQYGVAGQSKNSAGVRGTSQSGRGTEGVSTDGEGVVGFSTNSTGVWGQADGAGTGVQGTSKSGDGVFGQSTGSGRGVAGFSEGGQGVYGHSVSQAGVVGESDQFDGVFGESHSNQHAGVAGRNKAGGMAGFFDGDVVVTGDVTLTGADFAEEFDVSGATDVEPGTVMVLDQEGALQPSQQAYDKRVAGVISGAGNYKPGIVLDKQQSSENRMPVALVGKVYCKVDAQYASVEVGDLLTTSLTPGHAMKADDPFKAFGSVIGKALRPLQTGQGLIPILIALQ
jgi:hypothetical protein